MKEIPLTQGKVAIVDDQDYEWLSQYRWHCQSSRRTFYACAWVSSLHKILMHRLILCAPRGMEVDHKNRHGLDNRRDNLRLATRSQNNWNRPRNQNNTSGYKGVVWKKGAWEAQISSRGKYMYLGRYDSLEHARDAYNDAARRFHGEFMHL